MWARHFEVSLAIWLSLSWLIFRYPENSSLLLVHDFFIAAVIATISLLNYKYRYIHLLNVLTSLWLIIFAYFNYTSITNVPYQNYMVLGLILLMFSIIPPRASYPPEEWEEFIKMKQNK